MKIKTTDTFLPPIVCNYIINSCTETYVLQANIYEEVSIVEASTTNEFKTQEIKLTKLSRFEDKFFQAESGAIVYSTDENGNKYDFRKEAHKYLKDFWVYAPCGDYSTYSSNIKPIFWTH